MRPETPVGEAGEWTDKRMRARGSVTVSVSVR